MPERKRQKRTSVLVLCGVLTAAVVVLLWLFASGYPSSVRSSNNTGNKQSKQGQKTNPSAETAGTNQESFPRSAERRQLVQRISSQFPELKNSGSLDALRTVPRHLYVSSRYRSVAYENRPLPIGHGQTISQPAVVALMTQKLDLKPGETVLEIGTGSGYQASVLAEITDRVYSIEILEELAGKARKQTDRAGYTGVEIKQGDGYYGWEEHAPFDGIIVTCAAGHIPPPLIDQLAPNGRMIIPVGGEYETQRLILVKKNRQGETSTRTLTAVRFVPMTGRARKSK